MLEFTFRFVINITANGRLYFMFNQELWGTDGTAAGTQFVKAFTGVNTHVKVFNDALFIRTDMELWNSDGTATGTQKLGTLDNMALTNNGLAESQRADPYRGQISNFYVVGQTVYYAGGTSATGTELYKFTIPCKHTVAINAANGTTFCKGSTVSLQAEATGSSDPIRYTWSNNTQATTLTVGQSGTYTVTATDTKGCAVRASVAVNEVTLPPSHNISAGGATEFCQGQSVVLNSTSPAGLVYQWRRNGQDIAGATRQTFTATESGQYTMAAKNGCGESVAAPVSISVLSAPQVSIVGSRVICTPISATAVNTGTLSASATGGTGAYRYQWQEDGRPVGGNSATLPVNVPSLQGRSYIVTITDAKGCAGQSTSAVVRHSLLSVSVEGDSEFCPGSSGQLIARGLAPIGYNQATAYRWFRNNELIDNETGYPLTARQPGTYTAELTDNIGCKLTSAGFVVTLKPSPTATITPLGSTQVYEPSAVTLTANTGAGLTHQWQKDNVLLTGATTARYEARQSGNYAVRVGGSNGCTALSEVVRVQIDLLLATEPPLAVAQLTVYPNPTAHQLTILARLQQPGPVEVRLLTAEGRTVMQAHSPSRSTEHRLTLRLSDLPGGMYWLCLDSDEGRLVKTVLKE